MRIILSPAKQMVTDTDSLACTGLPRFLPRAERLLAALRAMTPQQRRARWHCSDKIAAENEQRLRTADLRRGLTPALLAYDGIQYKTMAPGVFTAGQLDYVGQYLRILSGFYGILRPFDGVVPYRLEMQAKLAVGGARDLYGFWGDTIAADLFDGCGEVLDLASREYSRCVTRYRPASARVVGCRFVEDVGGRLAEKGTYCKMARGEMVRYLAETGARSLEDAKNFDRLGYRFLPEASAGDCYVFRRDPDGPPMRRR